jgi:hypothetical protein
MPGHRSTPFLYTLLEEKTYGSAIRASAHYVNHEVCNRKVLAWQTGYGVVSFGTKDLPWVVAYVRNQKSHHAAETTHERLERITPIEHDYVQW